MDGEQRDDVTAQATTRKATLGPNEADTRLSRQLLESLMQAWIRDAHLLGDAEQAGTLIAGAGEVAEIGLDDMDRARQLYERASGHPDADPRAFAGLRRIARAGGDPAGVAETYRAEIAAAQGAPQAMFAAVGLAHVLLRQGSPPAEVVALLREHEDLLQQVPAETAAVFRATLEDALFASGDDAGALAARAQRWNELRLLGDDTSERWGDVGALSVAVASEVVGSSLGAILDWYEVAFEASRSIDALRPLLRSCYDRGDAAAAAALISEVTAHEDDVNARSRYQYELGVVRAHRLDDRPGGLSAIAAAMKGGDVSPLAATTFLGLARSSQGSVVADEFVDALGASLDFAASGIERADLLTQMAERFDGELDMTDAALELARDALLEAPNYAPALRLLGHVYSRTARWDSLAELGEHQLTVEECAEERLRLHERLADLYANELHDPTSAERHLRAALDHGAHLRVIRRLARLLSEQFRWEELFDHVRDSAARVRPLREKVYLLEQAGEVAETRLRDADVAIEVYRELLALIPAHPGATASLGRLLSQHERWSELLDLNEHELEQTGDDPYARLGILCRSAEIARRHLGDISATEEFYRRALDEEPTCGEALRGLGQILTAQHRWDEIVEMTEREMAAGDSAVVRRRCLRLLGETHAAKTGRVDLALQCFEELAATDGPEREEALVWLERLFEATGDATERLRVLLLRHHGCDDEPSRARLSFRIAELLEWGLGRPGDAFEHYVEALADPISAPVALNALDRTWASSSVDDASRHAAIRCAKNVAERWDGEIRRQALSLVGERGQGLILDAERLQAWNAIAREWPEDVRAAEFSAVAALRAGNIEYAETLRASAPAGPIEVARTHWAAVDYGIPREDLYPLDGRTLPGLAGALAREDGSVEAPFPHEEDRDTFLRMRAGFVTLGELRCGDRTEAGLRLAVLASRALGDSDGLRTAWEDVIEFLGEDAPRATRAWLDLASEDGLERDDRVSWLRGASESGCYDPRLRDELYQAMSQVGDLDGLEQAIAIHLREADVEAADAARLSLRRGRCLEMRGRRDDAIDALRFSVIHAPDDSAVALEKARLETLSDDLEGARSTLEDCLNAGVASDGRIEVLGRLADLHQMPGGVRQRAIAALEDAYELSNQAKDWATRLASAHAGFGHAGRCVELLEAALPDPPDVGDIRHWQLLARVYSSRLERPERAEEILWSLFDAFPTKKVSLSGLEEFYRRFEGARAFADRLGTLLSEDRLGLDDAETAGLWKYVGELNSSVLRRFPEAADAFRRAREAGGVDADIVLRQAKATGKQPGKVRDAVPMVIEALNLASADARLWEDAFVQLEGLFGELRDLARLRVARQMRSALGANLEVEEERIKREPTREIEPTLCWNVVGSGLFDEPDLQVLQALGPLAEKALARNAPLRKHFRGRKLRREEFAGFDAFLDNATQWLGVERPKVSVGDETAPPQVLDTGHFWVPESRIGDDEALRARFWAGWIAGLTFTGLAPLTWVDDDLVRELLRGVAIRGLDLEPDGGSLLEEEVGGLLLTPQRRVAAAALREHVEILDRRDAEWVPGALCVADRAGLLVCGDVRTAVEEILFATGWDRKVEDPRTREMVVSDRRMRRLLLYAISDEYFMARYESGLGERPYLFA